MSYRFQIESAKLTKFKISLRLGILDKYAF